MNTRLLTATLLLLGLMPAAAVAGDDYDVKTSLVRPDVAPDPDVKGNVRLRDKKSSDQRFEVTVESTDPTLDHVVLIETAPGSGTFTSLGLMKWNNVDEVKLQIKTKNGQALPLGKTKVQQLEGHEVRVQVFGETILFGAPATISGGGGGGGGKGKDLKAQSTLTTVGSSFPGAKGVVKLRSRPAKGDERFRVSVEKISLSGGTTFRAFLENASGSGVLVDIGELVPSKNDPSEVRFVRKTKNGQALPFGATSVSQLTGRLVEVRTGGGELVAAGTTPSF